MTGPAVATMPAGLYLFAGEPNGKKPAHRGWQEAAVPDAAIPDGHNVCVFTGRFREDEALLVVDVDKRASKDGNAALLQLELEGCELPDTYTVGTPNGCHLYYRVKAPVRGGANVLGPGVDVRSHGQYVVGPGSVVDGKAYRIAKDAPIAEAPGWLVERCGQARERTRAAGQVACLAGTDEPIAVDSDPAVQRAREYLAHVDPAIEGEGGDGHTVQVAEHVGDFGISEARCLDIMAEIFDPRCSPPWGPEGLAQKVRNAYSYREKPIGCAHPAAEFCRVRPDDGPKKRERFRRYTVADLEKLPAPQWLVRDLIPENALAEVYGPPKAGKTFYVLDASLCVAAGLDFHGHFVRRAPVLYIAGEGHPAQLYKRVRAWQAAREVSDAEITDWHLLGERVDVSNPHVVRALLASLGSQRYGMVVIDTVNRCMDGDENSAEAMSKFVEGCDTLRAELGAAVVPIHHTGKDESKGSRGSTVLRGAIDTGILIRPEGAMLKVVVEDQKDAEPAPPAVFRRETAENGGGYLVTVAPADARRLKPMKEGRTKDAHDMLARLIEDEGEQVPGQFPGTIGIKMERWRAFFCSEMADKKFVRGGSAARTFRRAAGDLRTEGRTENNEEFVWLA